MICKTQDADQQWLQLLYLLKYQICIFLARGEECVFFVEDEYYTNQENCYPISKFDVDKYELIIAIGDPIIKKRIVESLPENTKYFSFFHEKSYCIDEIKNIGEGSIVFGYCIISSNIKIGNHSYISAQNVIGHDTTIGDYFTSTPGVKISGNCKIGDCVYIGVNSSIREKITIGDNIILGLNSGVIKDIIEPGTYVGSPVKKIK